MKTEIIGINQIRANDSNPRLIKDAKFDKLVNSILLFPKMLSIRPIVLDTKNVTLGGNMRFRALNYIAGLTPDDIATRIAGTKKYKRMTPIERQYLLQHWADFLDSPSTSVIYADDLSKEEIDEFIIKDNVGFGEWDWDLLADNYDEGDLEEWGLDTWIDDAKPEEGDGEPGEAKPLQMTVKCDDIGRLTSLMAELSERDFECEIKGLSN